MGRIAVPPHLESGGDEGSRCPSEHTASAHTLDGSEVPL